MIRSASPWLRVGSFGLCALLAACSGEGNSGTDNPDGGGNNDPDGGTNNPDGGNNVSCTPEAAFTGAPVTGSAGQWQWVPVPEAKCRSGSTTGFGVRLNPNSDKVYIFLEEGGACFNFATCQLNSDAFGSSDFTTWQGTTGSAGIFDKNNANNPVRDWNAVYIPYCTGDVHAGVATGVNVPPLGTPSNQSFVGLLA